MFLIEKLYVGQEFKSIQALSLFLTGAKIPPGNQYTNTINKFKRHFSWENIPHTRKIIITEIYDQPKVTLRKSKYTMQFISNLFSLQEGTYTKYELYVLLGLTDPRFTLIKYYTQNINTLKYSLKQYNYIHKQLDNILSIFFYQMIERIEKLDFIQVNKTYRYEFIDQPIEVPEDLIDNLNAELLKSYDTDNLWEIYHSSKKDEFKDQIKEKLKPYGISNYCRAYNFKFINRPTNLLAPDLFKMNQLILHKLKNESEFHHAIDYLISLQ